MSRRRQVSNSPQYMPFFVGDYARDTMHFSTEDHGAYLLLILHYWAHGGLPPGDSAKMRIAKFDQITDKKKWKKCKKAITPLFHRWRHKRIDAELRWQQIIKEKRALAGAEGGRRSRRKTNEERFVEAKQMDKQMLNQMLNQAGQQNVSKRAPSSISKRYITSSEQEAAREGSQRKSGLAATPELETIVQRKWGTRPLAATNGHAPDDPPAPPPSSPNFD